ncbi:Cardiolipin synthase A [Ephemeroptericola cinctiostellae]|uniref:Cardiolipin synthase n=1 Tax=Ephemeroptericola cinctiostellae TaxID=2268024 RepID=A0A345DBQ1_9BURK|nr:cardiolipin synthase [Ephemeroptericola cinctiostellae]AXF85789.1 Cardiolipin synthase A [Ephemeroptericola cinctiostellae]
MSWMIFVVIVHYVVVIYMVGRVMLRPYREPASRVAWMLVIIGLPIFGVLLYLMLGETNIGIKRVERMRLIREDTLKTIKQYTIPETLRMAIPEQYHQVFRIGHSINDFIPVGGNHGVVLADSEAAIDALIKDIDEAKKHVHVLFYIWLTDDSGLKVAAALMRAAQRGVTCRALADALGSRSLIGSTHWQQMKGAGVKLAYALPIGNPFFRTLVGRIDLRNHRKIMVIDNRITYCGSQNCADAAFAPKAKYAPWVDTVVRFTGAIAIQNQCLFASDWEGATHENLDDIWQVKPDLISLSCPAQVIGTGPTERHAAMSDVFLTMIGTARRDLMITTPYFVPNEPLVSALCIAARSGVHVTMTLPQRNDSWVVGAASRSYYHPLLKAGVHIYEYVGGLLHAKLMTVDGEASLIGSANMDRRSFDLNYENNIVFYDPELTKDIIARQQKYIHSSVPVTIEEVNAWSKGKQLWHNAVATIGPVL